MSLALWLPPVKGFALSLHSVPVYKGMLSRSWWREGEENSKWLTRVNIPFSVCFGKKHYTSGFYLSSTMKESGEKVVK